MAQTFKMTPCGEKVLELEAKVDRFREALKIIERNTITPSFARGVARAALEAEENG